MRSKYLLIIAGICSLGVNSCESLPYKSDVGLMSAFDAGAFELKFLINGLECKDIESKWGNCSYSLKEGSDLYFTLYIPPGPGTVRIFLPNRETEVIPFRDQEKPLEIKVRDLKKAQDGTVAIQVVIDETQGAIAGLIQLLIVDGAYEPLPLPQLKKDGSKVEVIVSPYSRWLGLIVGDKRTILEKVNKITFDSDGKDVAIESWSEILRSSYEMVLH